MGRGRLAGAVANDQLGGDAGHGDVVVGDAAGDAQLPAERGAEPGRFLAGGLEEGAAPGEAVRALGVGLLGAAQAVGLHILVLVPEQHHQRLGEIGAQLGLADRRVVQAIRPLGPAGREGVPAGVGADRLTDAAGRHEQHVALDELGAGRVAVEAVGLGGAAAARQEFVERLLDVMERPGLARAPLAALVLHPAEVVLARALGAVLVVFRSQQHHAGRARRARPGPQVVLGIAVAAVQDEQDLRVGLGVGRREVVDLEAPVPAAGGGEPEGAELAAVVRFPGAGAHARCRGERGGGQQLAA